MNPVRLGFIGCGIVARDLHWPALQQLKEKFEAVHVCSRSEAKAREFADLTGAPRYSTDYRELLKDPKVEAVIIAYPFELNYELTKAALGAGKHVLVEKPLAATLEEGRELVSLSESADRVAAVAENYRYRPVFAKIKRYIGEGRIGRPCKVIWNGFGYLPRDLKYLKDSTWRHTSYGGFILDGGVHQMAGLQTIFGRMTKGIAHTVQMQHGAGEPDGLTYLFEFENGVSGIYHNYLSIVGYSYHNLLIFGTEGSIILENNQLTVATQEGREQEKAEDDGGYTGEFDDFYSAIRNGTPTQSSIREAFYDLQALLHALESTNKWDDFTIGPLR
ncbi:Gfo/Idh/MocA family protein [Paenibacillus humicola]|uniref:Gfo/Idh/MocA family protein n=1 Tax=Paenibacillus humicola TaxID=3110540 RepID=UPI00237A5538|nr:Gfo/Idh/MocA family oxidoreductase [Paenibacillus humicola]